jgi:antitoxin MazE
MNTTIKKWGNSLALRIPKSYAKEIELEEGAGVNMKIEENKIIISAKRKRKKPYSLAKLLSKVTPENLHEKIDFGSPVGKEVF